MEDGDSGFLLDVDDGRALRERLERLASDPQLVRRMGQRSRKVGEERFDMLKNAAQIGDMLVALAAPRRA